MVKDSEPIVHSICKILYGHALPFNLIKSPLFVSKMKMVGEYGRGLKLPSYREARVVFLKKGVDNVKVTRFATSFLTLKSFEHNKILLQAMFASQESFFF
ncbi:Uncharacterized protein TCM_003863 [Theobroma cacao]|uniref:Uncharacterized protein n=1 Tax=Theobroma cacao TaxID=3641 RepID=A0A061DPE2_THECC|nr:Uncharacterized protein TCM_003863 [Theobroma cacao]